MTAKKHLEASPTQRQGISKFHDAVIRFPSQFIPVMPDPPRACSEDRLSSAK